MLDPYAKAVEGSVRFNRSIFDHRPGTIDEMDIRDSQKYVPRSVVVSPYFDWGDDRAPRLPRRDTVLYETHVKGMTQRHPDVPPELRGTFAGMAHPSIVDHLVDLGVTALELMPVHQFFSESFLAHKGLSNYWGYATIGLSRPSQRVLRTRSTRSAGPGVQESRQDDAHRRHRSDPRCRVQPHL